MRSVSQQDLQDPLSTRYYCPFLSVVAIDIVILVWPECIIREGGYHYVAPLMTGHTPDEGQCAKRCDRTTGCMYWTHHDTTKACNLIEHESLNMTHPLPVGVLPTARGTRYCTPEGK